MSSVSASTSSTSWATHDHQHHKVSDCLLSFNQSPSSIEFEDLSKSRLLLSLGIFQNPSISSVTDTLFHQRIAHYVKCSSCFKWKMTWVLLLEPAFIILKCLPSSMFASNKRDMGFILESALTILKKLTGQCLSHFQWKKHHRFLEFAITILKRLTCSNSSLRLLKETWSSVRKCSVNDWNSSLMVKLKKVPS